MANISAPNDRKYVKPVSSKAKIIGGIVNVLSTPIFFITLAAIIAFIILLDHNPDVLFKYTVEDLIDSTNLSRGDARLILLPRNIYLVADEFVIIGCIVSGIASLASFIFMMYASARSKEGIYKATRFDKIPFELALCILLAIALLLAFLTGLSLMYINEGGTHETYKYYSEYFKDEVYTSRYYPPTYGVRIFAAVLLVDILAAFTISLTFFYTVAARIKTKTLLKNTVIFRILRLIYRILRWIFINIFKRFFNAIGFAIKSLPATWYYVLLLVTYFFVNLISILFFVDNGLVFVFVGIVLFNVASIYFVIRTATSFKLVQQATKLMASGNLRYKIATHSLRGPIKSHAECLNSISDAVSLAVEQQMKSERFKTELITNVSHDIKTPVTSIINYVGLIKAEHIENERAAEYIDVIDRQSQRLKKLTEDILEASKASAGVINTNISKTNVSELLKQCAGEYSERMESAGLDLVLDISDEIYAMCDGRLMWRVFDNLLSNAHKYSQSGTRVYITTNPPRDNFIPISIKNISKNRLNIPGDELMERFVRGDLSRQSEGSGLGLSISKSLMNLQNGDISITIDGDFFKAEVLLPIK